MNIRRIIRISLMTAILAALSQISLPIGPVPFTLQTFGVLLCGFILGPVDGFISVLIYLLLGAIGVPVFASFSGGLDKLVGRTGGYLFAFPIAAFIAGYAANKYRNTGVLYFAGLLAFVITHLIGASYFIFLTKLPLSKALVYVFYPFIIPDLVKMVLAVNIGIQVKKRITN